jgi:hypothetical protein
LERAVETHPKGTIAGTMLFEKAEEAKTEAGRIVNAAIHHK